MIVLCGVHVGLFRVYESSFEHVALFAVFAGLLGVCVGAVGLFGA